MRFPLVVALLAIPAVAVSAAFLVLSMPPAGEGDREVVLSLEKTELRGDRSLTYTIVNRSRREVSFGEPYDVQVLRGDGWVSAEWMRGRVWIMILYTLRPGDSFSRTIELPPELEPGTYTLVKEVTLVDTGVRLVLTAEFVVRR